MQKHSGKYDLSIHDELENADWDTALLKAFNYAEARAKKFQWLGDEVEPEALVNEAVTRAYGVGANGAYRNWNKAKCPDLGIFLIGIIRSMTSHMAEHEADFPKESFCNEDGSGKEEQLANLIDETTEPPIPKTPEEEIIEIENLQALNDELNRLADEDEDLGMVILCIKDGICNPRDIVDVIGFEKKTVNNLLKKLRRKLKNYNPKKKQSSRERQEEWA
ncbi:RNA polymerase sigma factor, sigma-70 family [delta proteobacterium NaphS2]|nr:RNA polymerase sigma factor, sigma-70 family [delta proteobacterium NaphS2]